MDIEQIQTKINNCFLEYFGYTPMRERLNDIQSEFFELMKATDVPNQKEEAGHLITSLIQLCNENDWHVDEMIESTLNTIAGRADQYKSLGRKLNIAILGGYFNPIHKGHIQLAQFVLNTVGIFDEVWIMPAYHHMLKDTGISAEDRLEMCRLAAKVDNRIKIFDYEIKNKLAGETYYFLKKLKLEKELTEKYRFSIIVGMDNANKMPTWVNFTELEKMGKFIVIQRKGVERDYNIDWYLQKPHIFLNCETPIMEISSNEIRKMLAENRDLNKLKEVLAPEVINYIITNNLYND
jgi:nicotinate-nucleotide adenylyltransferase